MSTRMPTLLIVVIFMETNSYTRQVTEMRKESSGEIARIQVQRLLDMTIRSQRSKFASNYVRLSELQSLGIEENLEM